MRRSHAKGTSGTGLFLVGVLSSVAVAAPPSPHMPSVEVTFAAHREHARLVIDHMRGLATGGIIASAWLRWPGAPFHLEAEGRIVAALKPIGPGTVELRPSGPGEPLPAGRVEPSWENGAIRMILRTVDGERLETGFFERPRASGAWQRLSRLAQTNLDVRGTYQAVLRHPDGTSVGWLRVCVDPSGTPVRSYEGVLPAFVTPGLAAAAILALDTEIDWIEDHSLDVYRGS